MLIQMSKGVIVYARSQALDRRLICKETLA